MILQQEDRSWKEAVRHERLEYERIEKDSHLEEFKIYFFFNIIRQTRQYIQAEIRGC